jgi:hypothetical protein
MNRLPREVIDRFEMRNRASEPSVQEMLPGLDVTAAAPTSPVAPAAPAESAAPGLVVVARLGWEEFALAETEGRGNAVVVVDSGGQILQLQRRREVLRRPWAMCDDSEATGVMDFLTKRNTRLRNEVLGAFRFEVKQSQEARPQARPATLPAPQLGG